MYPVSVVTIENKTKLFSKKEAARSVELIHLKEVGYEIIAQKDLYSVGDKAVLIFPDYCLSDATIFDSFTKPNGDPEASLLGKVDNKRVRVKAKKFNLSKTAGGPHIYSNGILMPYDEVLSYICQNVTEIDKLEEYVLHELLGVYKFVPKEDGLGNLPFPMGINKTDETNINELELTFPITLVGTQKIDGSSISIGKKDGEAFICSRNNQKELFIKELKGVRKATNWEMFKSWFGIIPDLREYHFVLNTDIYVTHGLSYMKELSESLLDNLVLRGELHGKGTSGGSGNKLNPSTNLEAGITFFGMDKIEDGIARPATRKEFTDTIKYLSALPTSTGFDTAKVYFTHSFNSMEELMERCNKIFEKEMIEGIVVRTQDGKFSAKVMNQVYDSKK